MPPLNVYGVLQGPHVILAVYRPVNQLLHSLFKLLYIWLFLRLSLYLDPGLKHLLFRNQFLDISIFLAFIFSNTLSYPASVSHFFFYSHVLYHIMVTTFAVFEFFILNLMYLM